MKIKTQKISSSFLKDKNIELFVKRIDLIHEYVSGNKWYKLKYNLIEAKKEKKSLILTLGGAYSNHIAATAYLAKKNGFKSIGIIRGEETFPLNPTLSFAKSKGMKLHYISRNIYRCRYSSDFLNTLRDRFADFYFIPEGGTNKLGIKGAEEIIDKKDTQDYICCAVGTGGTISGIINATHDNQKVIGFPAIKGSSKLEADIKNWTNKNNYEIINSLSSSGYAKLDNILVDFIFDFYKEHSITLDAIYTAKMMMSIFDLVNKNYFTRGSSILAIHTGGVQGNKGMNQRFGYKLPIHV